MYLLSRGRPSYTAYHSESVRFPSDLMNPDPGYRSTDGRDMAVTCLSVTRQADQ